MISSEPLAPDAARVDSARSRIGFLTQGDPRDRKSWSGTYYYMSQALQRNCGDVVYLGPIRSPFTLLGKAINRLSLTLLGRRYDFKRSKWYARRIAAAADRLLAGEEFAYIVAPSSAVAIAYLQPQKVPLVFITDATFDCLNDYYPGNTDNLEESVKDGHELAARAMQNADLLLFASRWAAESAVERYGMEPEKVHVVPFGANIDGVPPKEVSEQRQRSGECRLMFLGVDWVRKGGDIAFETLLALEKSHGIKAHLTVCGCAVPEHVQHDRLTKIRFLDKSDPEQAKVLDQLYRDSDYFLLPTRKEAYGVVFCEASAYGLPSFSTDTGGVSGVIAQGRNGFVLPEAARGEEYARLIAEYETDDTRYRALCRDARAEYDNRINWDTWAVTADGLVRSPREC